MDEMDYVSHSSEAPAPAGSQATASGAGTGAGLRTEGGQSQAQSALHPFQGQNHGHSQQPQPSGCPYFRGVGAVGTVGTEHHHQPHFPQHPSHLPLPPQHPQFSQQQHPILNPHQAPTQSHSQSSQQQQIQHPAFLSQPQNRNTSSHQGLASIPHLHYDPVHAANSNNWYPAVPWSGPAGLPSHPPLHHHHHSRTSSSDTYFNSLSGHPQGPGSAGLGLGSVGVPGGSGVPGLGLLHGQAPQHQLPHHEPFPHYFYRQPLSNVHRFPGVIPSVSHNQSPASVPNLNQSQSSMNNASSSQPGAQQQQSSSQSTSRGISLPTPNPPPPPPHFATSNMSGSGESSPDLPPGRRSMFDSSRGSNRSENSANSASSSDLPPPRPAPTSLFGDPESSRPESASTARSNQATRGTPPPAANPERRRGYPPRAPMPVPDYDSDDELDQLEDEHQALRFIEQFSMSGNFTRDMGEAQVRAHQILRGQMPNKRVASKKALSQLQSVDMDSLEESERTCVICYNEFGVENPEGINEAPLRLPGCKHIFGDHCIKKWFEESDSCPYCRDKVPSEPIISSSAQYIRDLYRTFPSRRGVGVRGTMQDLNIRIVPDPRGDDSRFDSSPPTPRGWQTGDRRSPPSESSDSRRRTRPRHSFRGSPSAAGSNRHGSSHAGSSSAMPPLQQGPARERVNHPNRPHWHPSVPNVHRGLTTHSAIQFTSHQRPYYPVNSMGRFSMPSMPPSYQPVEPLGLNSPASMAPHVPGFGPMMNMEHAGNSSVPPMYIPPHLGGPGDPVLSAGGDPLPGPAQLDAYSQQLPSSASLPPVVNPDQRLRAEDAFFPVSR